jgi:3-methyladenine DNA glycosylase AlkC
LASDRKETETNPQAFKHLFGRELLDRLSRALSHVYVDFDQKAFIGLIPQLETLEMKPRVQLIREELRRQLPQDYKKALAILTQVTQSKNLDGFDLWPISDFIQTYGLDEPVLSLEALKELTSLFSSEFAVRPFLKHRPTETLQFLKKCALDSNEHIRRWASEGSRPRLPWGERLQEFVRDPSPTLPILELLKFDPEIYVRKSVSNHLNDIAKDHPEKVIQILEKWKKAAGTEHETKLLWIIRHSLRTLIKAGHPEALELIGVSSVVEIKVSNFKINKPSFKLGDRLEFGFEIRSQANKPQKLVVDYIIHYLKSNQKTSPKVFKLKTLQIQPKEIITIRKSHHIKKVTTRVHYPGTHAIEIQINGKLRGRLDWNLKKS